MDADDRLNLLANLPDEPMPEAVVSRLDAVVARLVAERAASREGKPTPAADPLTKDGTATPAARHSHS